jgi:hypothetical protein
MPLSYQFISVETGLPAPLDDIDARICADVGKPCSVATYSLEFRIVTDVGDAAWATGTWDEDKFVKLMAPFDDAFRSLCRKYLNGEYKYDCWYQHAK